MEDVNIMIEYIDGQFGDMLPVEDMMKRLKDMVDIGQFPKSVHFGNEFQLKAIKTKKSQEDQLKEQEEKLKDLEYRLNQLSPTNISKILSPTPIEIKQFGSTDSEFII